MKYQQRLQVAVRERLRKLMTAPHSSAGHEVHLAATWINNQPALKGLLEEAARTEPSLDQDSFRSGLVNGQLTWPSRTEDGQATLVWGLMQHIANAEADNPDIGWQIASGYSTHRNIQDNWREFTEDVLRPLFDFLSERVGAESSVLHTLERYRTRIEWFDREELYTRFTANLSTGEEVYNLDLQRFLFLEGDHITHAKPRSASGEADLVGELDGRDPLVCDGKIFDGSGRGKGYLAKGLHQIVKYAHDYGQHTAYLVIYNITDKLLELPTDGTPAPGPRAPNSPASASTSSTSASCHQPPPPAKPAKPPESPSPKTNSPTPTPPEPPTPSSGSRKLHHAQSTCTDHIHTGQTDTALPSPAPPSAQTPARPLTATEKPQLTESATTQKNRATTAGETAGEAGHGVVTGG